MPTKPCASLGTRMDGIATIDSLATSTILLCTIAMLLLGFTLLRTSVPSFLSRFCSSFVQALGISPSSESTGQNPPLPLGTMCWAFIGGTFHLCSTNPNIAQKTVLTIICGLMLGTLWFRGIVHHLILKAGVVGELVLSDHVFFPSSQLMFSIAGLIGVVSLLVCAKNGLALGNSPSSATRLGSLLLSVFNSMLIHLLVPENAVFDEPCPTALHLALVFFFFCSMGGVLLIFFGTFANPGEVFFFHSRGRTRAEEQRAVLDALTAASRRSSAMPAMVLAVLSSAGLIQLLLLHHEGGGGGLIRREVEIPVFALFVSLMLSLFPVLVRISEQPK